MGHVCDRRLHELHSAWLLVQGSVEVFAFTAAGAYIDLNYKLREVASKSLAQWIEDRRLHVR